MNPLTPSTPPAITTSNGVIIRWVIFTFIGALLLIALWLARDIAMITLMSIIFAILLTTPVRFFVRLGAPRTLAVLLTIALVIASIVVINLLILPGLLTQFSTLLNVTLPAAADRLRRDLTAENLLASYPFLEGFDLNAAVENIQTQLIDRVGSITSQVLPLVSGVAGALVNVLIVLFLSMYFVSDPNTHQQGLLRLFPVAYRPRAYQILVRLDEMLRRFLQAQILIMVLIGFTTGLALLLMEVPLSTALGTITGILAFIPNFGPLISLVPILAVGIINTPDKIVAILVVFVLIQFVYSQIVSPILFGSGVNLPPALILLSQIIFGLYFGFLGIILSVPLAAIGVVLIREIYIYDILGDRERVVRSVDPELALEVKGGLSSTARADR